MASPAEKRGVENGHDAEKPAKQQRRPVPPVPSASSTSQASRPSQEDRMTVVDDGWVIDGEPAAGSSDWPSCRFYAVFDGHCGAQAAEAASTALWARLQPALIELQRAAAPDAPADEALERALREAFRATEELLLANEADDSGTTAVCGLVLGEALWLSHVGDSRAVLCHAERAVRMTEDHKPNVPREEARIIAAGGEVTTPLARGTENVPRLNGTLSVSRSLGDAPFKRQSGEVLSAEPDVSKHALVAFDQFLLLASDGVWDVMSDEEAVAGVLQELQSKWPRKTPEQRTKAACDKVVREVMLSGRCADNVTAVLVLLEGTS